MAAGRVAMGGRAAQRGGKPQAQPLAFGKTIVQNEDTFHCQTIFISEIHIL